MHLGLFGGIHVASLCLLQCHRSTMNFTFSRRILAPRDPFYIRFLRKLRVQITATVISKILKLCQVIQCASKCSVQKHIALSRRFTCVHLGKVHNDSTWSHKCHNTSRPVIKTIHICGLPACCQQTVVIAIWQGHFVCSLSLDVFQLCMVVYEPLECQQLPHLNDYEHCSIWMALYFCPQTLVFQDNTE